MPISVTIICYNEEKKIRRCLESLKWADEIIVLDSFSTDRTLEICREYTEKVFQHQFDGHIQQKNRALGLCSNNWVFCIDADEVVSKELVESIIAIDTEKTDIKGFHVARRVFYIGKWINHCGWYPDYKIRLFDRRFGKWDGINPHDKVVVNGDTSKLKGDLFHYSYDDISAHLKQIDRFTDIQAKEYEKLGKEPSIINLTLRPLYKFIKMFILKLGFLDGMRGLIIASLGAFYVSMKFVKLYERKNISKSK